MVATVMWGCQVINGLKDDVAGETRSMWELACLRWLSVS